MQVEPPQPPFQVVLHARYNPEQLTALNIVPGLLGPDPDRVHTCRATSLAITREREFGHDGRDLLAMPVRPVEVMLSKIIPYVGLAYVQTALILGWCRLAVFGVPIRGSIPLLLFALGVFIACNLAMGFAFSTMATTQMQAQQLAQVRLAAVDHAVRLHVPVPGHAGMGARRRRGGAAHPRAAADLPRRAAERQRPVADLARSVADGVVRVGRGCNRGQHIRETLD